MSSPRKVSSGNFSEMNTCLRPMRCGIFWLEAKTWEDPEGERIRSAWIMRLPGMLADEEQEPVTPTTGQREGKEDRMDVRI